MVQVVALNAVASGRNSPAAALPQPSAEALQALAALVNSGGLSEAEVGTLSAVVARVDAGVQSAATRQNLLQQVSGLGLFFRNTDTNGFPRWPLMTALRAYGLNLAGQVEQAEVAVAAEVQQQLNTLAQQSRGTSLGQALAAATAAVVVGPVVQQREAPQPQPVKVVKAPAPEPVAVEGAARAVDKLV